ncbi:cilia- and flagella-associated protein 45-like [Sitophilus oryzae]|uniref:Cilia- and flagella-associated protein 45 n=1 Tax=Sitophilus oryzae TaxID=7048 RepID=A0A6J2XQQ2_SITOR|nr:cilia- and flagella-associated protein 45-like [Sitophilus oryzae]
MSGTGKFKSKAGKPKVASGDHTPDQCNHQINGKFIHYKPKTAYEGKEMVLSIENCGTRSLLVPNRYPIDTPAILPKSEFDRLKQKAKVLTLEDRMRMLDEAEEEKNRAVMESTARKEELLRIQMPQKKGTGSKLESVESEAAKKNLYLLQRSQELIIEQDERVKQANGMILATKCRAIRNAQIAEKKLIERQLKEEEQRLDKMMEQQRQIKIRTEERKLEEEEYRKQRYVKEVMQQMKENELERLLEAEKIEEESRMLNKALIELQKEDEKREEERKQLQIKMRDEFKKANEETQQYRRLKAEEQRIADLRVQEFMRQKAERDDMIEKEKLLVKTAKEKEIARLRSMQEKSQDLQAALDELNALRAQEEKEREWREQEKEVALRKARIAKELEEARAKQVEDIRKTQARALARDEEDFKKVASVQHELHKKELEKLEKKKEAVERHRLELLKQINEKERERINYQQERFEDGKAQRMEFALKDKSVEDYLKNKIEKLRDSNVPDNYIKDIERQLKLAGKG